MNLFFKETLLVIIRGVGTIFVMGGGYLFIFYIIYPIIYY